MWASIPGPWAASSPCTRLRAPSTRRGPCCWPRSVAATEVAESSGCAGFTSLDFRHRYQEGLGGPLATPPPHGDAFRRLRVSRCLLKLGARSSS